MPTPSGPNRRFVYLLFAVALVVTVLVYWPSTHGGYVFDDYPNIVENNAVHLQSLDWESLRAAALASPSPVLIRPLAMLSFGIGWYFSGGNPFAMKLVNLAIHLVNGVLLFVLLRRVTRFAAARGGSAQPEAGFHSDLVALCITAAWLLAPINFTAVGYVVQRMESLSQTFVLAGLWGYVAARERMMTQGRGLVAAVIAISIGTIGGALAKESALLLPLYAFVVEYCLFRFASSRGTDRRMRAFYVVVLAIPAALAALWALTQAFNAGAWTNRPFTLGERLLTEPRILLDYVRWSLLPTPNALALYHDQIRLSTSLFAPLTTLPSIVCLIVAACAIPRLRNSRPLAAIGIGWFLGAHLLTGTVIPLELVFEHRNYFASVGLYLLVFSLLLPRPRAALAVARTAACIALLVLFGTVTLIRSLDWSSPVAFVLSESEKNPDSPRTAYELGRTYVVASEYKAGSPLIPLAEDALERAARMPGADALPDQALLMLAARMHQPTAPAVWQRMQRKLATQPASAQNISAMHALTACAIEGNCDFPPPQMVGSFLAILGHSIDAPLLATYASYAINVLQDATLAVDLAQEGVQRQPQSLQARRNLMLVLQLVGRHDDAVALYQQTLRDLPEAAHDRAFATFSRDLLKSSSPATPAAAPPGS